MTNKSTPLPASSKIPTKWMAIVVFVLVAYGLTQPFVNRKFGWSLPSLPSVLGFEDKVAKPKSETDRTRGTTEGALTADQLESQLLGDDQVAENKVDDDKANDPSSVKTTTKSDASRSTASKSSATSGKSDDKLLYGLLKEVGREEYVSPAGLRYTRGSEEGHRLKHIERHLADIPDRPVPHGVFEGDMAAFLRLLDEAYIRAEKGDKGTSKTEEKDGRMKYEVTFSKPIGFVGGREGARRKNPDAKRLRMILAGDRVITAFPF